MSEMLRKLREDLNLFVGFYNMEIVSDYRKSSFYVEDRWGKGK